ncbi:MAG: Veg family protein [Eggerthellales bacterium]|nr:Veg family protein [Eggerthellales bacterium]
MDLQKQALIIDSIHDTLSDLVGQRLGVRENMGRSKIVEDEGILTQVHPRLFIMEIDRKRGRTARKSFQYADVLTGVVKLSQGGNPIFGRFVMDDEEEAEDEFAFDTDDEREEETVIF